MRVLRHTVGRSTLVEGIAVPRLLENWIHAPPAGEKRNITLLFDDDQVSATLRRIANARGHVQIKYENRNAGRFREWLKRQFVASVSGMEGEYLELARVEGDIFRVHAFPLPCQSTHRLVVSEWIFHRTNERAFDRYSPIREIPAIVQTVEFSPIEGQAFYNRQLSQVFGKWEWEAEKRVIANLPLKSDFMKGMVQVEVEFGNARTYYQDYIKFLLAFNQKAAEIGVLLVPTEAFAHTLCSVGRKRALAKGRHSYSGMIHLEKVRRELAYLDFMLSMPVAIAGIGVHEMR